MRELDQDELIDRWTLVGDELELVSGKRGATRLGFALLLRFYVECGRFPHGRGEIPDAAVEYVARQVGVTPTDIAFYEWSGRKPPVSSPCSGQRPRFSAVCGPGRR
ncbi:DUF4158 domain-containing protein [Candidatus Mycobacterium methanotrophicum]|uniref:DUF4158 domain-containing protein n=1 Tax=Candidatus Mycobacterium methanotrophicum TaxID=2943498 RepID=A0ABY4QQC7_9MYCO|nr:DUF4158 domain-containing protein [Candidatus Mycobacterium methanotrophicum]UQX13220.1 DUF4158 domain-containing protein [Candidatus Mycobacterium methanotrophicum]